jgi:hypothetical protein
VHLLTGSLFGLEHLHSFSWLEFTLLQCLRYTYITNKIKDINKSYIAFGGWNSHSSSTKTERGLCENLFSGAGTYLPEGLRCRHAPSPFLKRV